MSDEFNFTYDHEEMIKSLNYYTGLTIKDIVNKRIDTMNYITGVDEQIKIRVEDNDKTLLTIKDNGKGFSREQIKQITTFGLKQSVTGKYGLDIMYPCFQLTGFDGGFIMHTKSRETGEELKGYWSIKGFETDNNIEDILETEYGLAVQMYVEDDYTVEELNNHIDKFAKNSDIPIKYEQYNENKKLEKNRTYHIDSSNETESFELSDKRFNSVIETDLYKLKYQRPDDNATTDWDGRFTDTVEEYKLLGTEVKKSSYNLDWRILDHFDFELTIKDTNQTIVSGPHKNLKPAKDEIYKGLDDKTGYVPESELQNADLGIFETMKDRWIDGYHDKVISNNDVKLPEPNNNRKELVINEDFIDYLNYKVREDILEHVEDCLDTYSSTHKVTDDIFEGIALGVYFRYDSEFQFELDREYMKMIYRLSQSAFEVDRVDHFRQYKNYNNVSWSDSKPVFKILYDNDPDELVHYCIDENMDKYDYLITKLLNENGYTLFVIQDELFSFIKTLDDLGDLISKDDVDEQVKQSKRKGGFKWKLKPRMLRDYSKFGLE